MQDPGRVRRNVVLHFEEDFALDDLVARANTAARLRKGYARANRSSIVRALIREEAARRTVKRARAPRGKGA